MLHADVCNEEHIFMELQGRSSDLQGLSAGIYERVSNETMIYWTKESSNKSISEPKAIWFDQTYGIWVLGRLADLGSSLLYLKSKSSPLCPYISDTEWAYYDGTETVEENLDSKITLTPWNTGIVRKIELREICPFKFHFDKNYYFRIMFL